MRLLSHVLAPPRTNAGGSRGRGGLALLLTLLTLFGTGLAAAGLVACGGERADDAAPVALKDTTWALVLSPQYMETVALLQAVAPVSPEVAWVSGHNATYAITTNGGLTWKVSVMEGEEELEFRDVEAFDSLTAYLLSAGPGEKSRIYRTDDGGKSWRLQYQADDPDAFLDCMAFWDRQRGLAYGDAVDGNPFVLRTLDGGERWTRIRSPEVPPALEGEGGFAASGSCLQVAAFGKAWIATGAGPRARVLRTQDWGNGWTAVEVPVVSGESAGLTTLRVLSDGWGMALGGVIGGDTLRTRNVAVTEDGGLTWREGPPPTFSGPVYGSALVELAGGRGVVAVGPAGLTWSRGPDLLWQVGDSVSYWAVDFADREAGWAVGPEGRVVRLSFERGGGGPG